MNKLGRICAFCNWDIYWKILSIYNISGTCASFYLSKWFSSKNRLVGYAKPGSALIRDANLIESTIKDTKNLR